MISSYFSPPRPLPRFAASEYLDAAFLTKLMCIGKELHDFLTLPAQVGAAAEFPGFWWLASAWGVHPWGAHGMPAGWAQPARFPRPCLLHCLPASSLTRLELPLMLNTCTFPLSCRTSSSPWACKLVAALLGPPQHGQHSGALPVNVGAAAQLTMLLLRGSGQRGAPPPNTDDDAC